MVLSWKSWNTLDTDFCPQVVEEALERSGPPEIFNSDRGCQFTSRAFAGCLEEACVRVSMDGRGRRIDNAFIERLWRSLKYEAAHLQELAVGFCVPGDRRLAGVLLPVPAEFDSRPTG